MATIPRSAGTPGVAAASRKTALSAERRVSSGVEGLDIILNGGLLPGSIYLVEGVPGAGKTTLGLQFIYAGAVRHHEPGLIITFEEFPEQLERDAHTFGWDFRKLESSGKVTVLHTSPDSFRKMMEEPGGPIDQLARSGLLKRVLVDSVTHFQSISRDPAELRSIVYSFLNGLRRLGVTALLTKEIERDDPTEIPFEEYLVDGIIRMSNMPLGSLRRTRCIEVVKSRGQPHLAGRSGFRFSAHGIEVFPRLSSNWAADSQWLPESEGARLEEQGAMALGETDCANSGVPPLRSSTGVEGVDQMLEGGLLRGTSALVAGTSGTGKTLFCLQFLHAGLQAGESAVMLTVEENAPKLIQFAESVGIDLKQYLACGQLHIECCSAAEVTPGEALWRLYRLVRSRNAARVVIDSLNALFGEFLDPGMMQTSVQHLMHLFGTMRITTIVTWEIQDITGDLRISDHRLSAVVDTIILLRYVEVGSEMRRVIGIIKSRGTGHDNQLREFRVTSEGFKVESKMAGLSGLLRGSARGTPKETIEELLQPLLYIRDVVSMLRRGEIPQGQVDTALEGLIEEAERVEGTIRDRMGPPQDGASP